MNPVNRETLCDVRASSDRNQRPPVAGEVCRAVGRQPIAAAERRTNHDRFAADRNVDARSHDLLGIVANFDRDAMVEPDGNFLVWIQGDPYENDGAHAPFQAQRLFGLLARTDHQPGEVFASVRRE